MDAARHRRDAPLWSDFAAGDLITTAAAGRTAGLVAGSQYPVSAGTSTRLTVGAQAPVGISGVDGIVDQARGRQLGLVRNIAVLVNAPATSPLTLVTQVTEGPRRQRDRHPAGPGRGQHQPPGRRDPLHRAARASYLQLFQESAARYCPGLSWTVLAAIGQIESADGQNMGPSTAGALGPMQFLPSTWTDLGH